MMTSTDIRFIVPLRCLHGSTTQSGRKTGNEEPENDFFGKEEEQTLENPCGVHVVALCHNYLQNFEQFPLRSVDALMLRKQIEVFNKEMFRIQEERKTNNKVHEEQNLKNKSSQSDLFEDRHHVEQSPKRQECDSFPDFDCRDLDGYQSEAQTDNSPDSIDKLFEDMEHSESSTSAEASPELPNNDNNSNENQKPENQDSKRADNQENKSNCSEMLQAVPKRNFRVMASRRKHEQKEEMRKKQAEKKEAELLREQELKERMEEPTHQVLQRYRKESKAKNCNDRGLNSFLICCKCCDHFCKFCEQDKKETNEDVENGIEMRELGDRTSVRMSLLNEEEYSTEEVETVEKR
uniref:Ubiquitinyl hydrolase 1 n=1 Tax=Caenorhabditis tropicalis TaxID=1561998 RepID=A0A1I7TPG8_9PELO